MKNRLGPIALRTVFAGAVAVVATSVAFIVADAVAGPFVVEFNEDDRMTVSLGNVAFASVVGSTGGGVVAGLCQWMPRPRLAFLGITLVVLIASFAMPLMAGIDAATRLVLAGLHVVVGAVVIVMLAAKLPQRRAPHRATAKLRPTS